MKKIVSILLAAALCAPMLTAFADGTHPGGSGHSSGTRVYAPSDASKNAGGYIDIDSSASYANAVGRLYDFGVMRGYDDGTFRPDRVVTRAEAAALMCAAMNIHAEDIPDDIGDDTIILWNDGNVYSDIIDDYEKPSFSDVDKSHWAYKFIIYAAQMHPITIQGYGDGTFHPDETVTYAEFVKMCVCLLGYDIYAAHKGYPEGYIEEAENLGLTEGLGARKNDGGITRADAAVILANTLEAPIVGVGEWYVNPLTDSGFYMPMQMNGTGEDFKNLLMIYFGIYRVTASVSDPNATPVPEEIDPEAYETAFADLTELNILDDDFDPDAEITKGEFTKYARRLMYPSDVKVQSPYRELFTDVPDDRNDIHLMLVRGYIDPDTAVLFGINDKITYTAAAEALVHMVYGYGSDSLYETYMDVAVKNGIAQRLRNPNKTLTGSELAVMLYNCLDKTIETVNGDNKKVTAEGNTLRNMLLGGGGVNRIEDKGEKIFDFKNVEVGVKEGLSYEGIPKPMTKIGRVTFKENQDVIISLDDSSPAYINYFVRMELERPNGTFTDERVNPYAPGDMFVTRCFIAGEYDVYLGTTSAPVTVSGSIYVRDTVWEE